MGTAPLKPYRLNDGSRLHDEPERKDEVVVARRFVEVSSDKRKKEPYLVEDVLVVKVVRRFDTRAEARDCAYGLAGWAGTEQAQRGRKQDSWRVGRGDSECFE